MNIFEIVKGYLSFEDVAGYYGITFQNTKALCPFHDDKVPSFHSYGTHGYCFGCGKVADTVDLESHFTRLPPFEAALSLAKRYEIPLPEFSPKDREKADKQAKVYQLLERSVIWANRNIKKHLEVLEFLKKKGLDEADIDRYQIGFVGDEHPFTNNLNNLLDLDGTEIALGKEIGLINEYGDHFKSRIIFPIWSYGKIVFLTGRAFLNGGEPKYLHLKNSELIYKQIAFAENLTKDFCLIVEGITDAIAFIKSGIPACALLGKEISEANRVYFEKAKAKLYFALDPDEAGKKASYELSKEFKGYTLNLGYEKDPDEVLAKLGPEEFKRVAEKAIEGAPYYLDSVIETENTREALKEIASLDMESDRDIWLKKLALKYKKDGVTITSLRIDLHKVKDEMLTEERVKRERVKREREKGPESQSHIPKKEAIDLLSDQKHSIHPASDLLDGKLYFGTGNGAYSMLIHDKRVLNISEIPKQYKLTGVPDPLRFSVNGIKTYHKGAEIRGVKLYTWIYDFLSKHIVFKAQWQLVITVLWIIGTYLHRCFDLYPYLWISSPTKRCGKTLVLEILAEMCFNSDGIQTAPTEAVLFRQAAITAGTLCWDEAEALIDDKKKGERNSILNVAFRKGGKVARCEGENHEVKNYEVYRPIALAGISSLPDTAADRSLKIELIRKRKDEDVMRLKIRRLQSELQSLRDALHIFALERAPKILEAYDSFPDDLIPEGVDDRLRDIFEVVFSVAGGLFCYDKEKFPPILAHLRDAANALSGIRTAAEDDTSFIRAIQILKYKLDESREEKLILRSEEAVKVFQSGGIAWVVENKHAGKLLRNLGFRSKSHRVVDEFVRGYEITLQQIEDLFQRYGSNVAE